MDNLDSLNQQQKEAVTATEKQILVIAGAGSGKTKVLVSRAAWLIEQQHQDPRQLMAVTFTNKAANEMKERLERSTGIDSRWLWIGTFHSLCVRILRRENLLEGYDHNFTIYDTADQKALIKKCLADMGLASEERLYSPQLVLGRISDAKNRLLSVAEFATEATDQHQRNIAELYRRYQRRLKENNAFDFDDLLTETVWLLQRQPEVLAKYQQMFKHILVDEYQDINHCQYRLISLLAGDEGNLFVVGDPDQSIYGWRGADISNILDFVKDYPDCREIQLNRNYRSTSTILTAANSLIANNNNRKPKDLFTEGNQGEPICFVLTEDDREEAFAVIRTVAALLDEGYQYSDCAVLYRTHGQSAAIERACMRFGIPYRVFGGIKFYERKEVKDTIAYLRLLVNPDDGESLQRIYNEPKRGIGKTTWDKLQQIALQRGENVGRLLAVADQFPELSGAAARKLKTLATLLDQLRDFVAETDSVAAIINELWQRTDYKSLLDEKDSEKLAERLDILEQLYNTATTFDEDYQQMFALSEEDWQPPLNVFLNQTALAMDSDGIGEGSDYLTLMTLHAAKGLEYPVIFIVGMEDGVFPHRRAIFSLGDNEMEEERRLCYVGITRARERLFLSAAKRRLTWGTYENNRLSRFISEIPQELLEISGVDKKRIEKSAPTDSGGSLFVAGTVSRPTVTTAPTTAQLFMIGDKVRHGSWGDGVVVQLSGNGEDAMISVAFPGVGIKKLLVKYAPIKKI